MTGKKPLTDMPVSTYRNLIWSIIAVISAYMSIGLLVGCSKEKPAEGLPRISFIHGPGFISKDTIISVGQHVKVGVNALGAIANITYFSIRFSDGTSRILLDSGMNSVSFNYQLDIIKTNALRERWTFFVMDRQRNRDSVSLYLTKADTASWGPINIMNNILLGAQENPASGSFYSLNADSVMTLDQAFENQQLTDIVYYYGQYEGTLASPAEAEAPGFFTGPHGIANWTVKNETRYDTTLITPEQFDSSMNDSLILSVYEPAAGKKKGKYVQPGMVFSFRSPSGKPGLICIQEMIPGTAGSVRLSVKIQK
jgi:hypothetical protein